MRARGLLLVPALLLPAAGVVLLPADRLPDPISLLPEPLRATVRPEAPPPAPPPAPSAPAATSRPLAVTAAPASASASPPAAPSPATPSAAGAATSADEATLAAAAAVDPATLATLPAALVDDGSDDAAEPEPEPPPEPAPAPKDDRPRLASIARETWVFAEPRWSSRKLGYLRAGATVERRAKPAGWSSCPDGWYRIQPKGYVCAGATATLDLSHPAAIASAKRPAMDALPYVYAMGRFPPPPLYTRLPTRAEQQKAEPDLVSALRKAATYARDPAFVAPPPADPLPAFLEGGAMLPPLGNVYRARDAVTAGRARVRSGFALLGTYEHEGRSYGLTTDLTLLPLDRVRIVKPSVFHGIALDESVTLPVAFVRRKHAFRFTIDERGALARGEPLAHREAVPLTGAVKRSGGADYLEAKDGSFVLAERVVRVDRMKHRPAWAAAGRKWIDVSILRQALVAYEGERPVYVTLVSTGADGTGDPKKTHSTIQGAFLIHTKHTTVTMDGDQVGDEFDFRDVPFVQYFTEGYALHAAYWHDEFGTPRSHGCVNLAPIDAAWLFRWTDPPVPEGWHAALSLKRGTLVYTHP